jgi:UDP-glucose 4-epimerase
VLAERLVENYAAQFGIPYVILRFSTVIAPEESLSWFRFESSLSRLRRAQLGKNSNLWPLFVDHPRMDQLVSETVHDPSGNPAVALLGPGRKPWGMPITDVRDIVQAILHVSELRDAPNDCFNIAGKPVMSDEGAKIIAAALGLPLFEVELPVRWNYEIDTTKARATFGYEPAWSFADTVHDALQRRGQEPSTTP